MGAQQTALAERTVKEALAGLDLWAVKNVQPREAIDLLSGRQVLRSFLGRAGAYDRANGVLGADETLDSVRFASVQFVPEGTTLETFKGSGRDVGLPAWGGVATKLSDDVFARSTLLAADRVPARDWGFMATTSDDMHKVVLERLVAEETVDSDWGRVASQFPEMIRKGDVLATRKRILNGFRGPLGGVELQVRGLSPSDIRGLYVEPARPRGIWTGLDPALRSDLQRVARERATPMVTAE